jgi:hypothetical protein
MQLHKTEQARAELKPGVRTLGQRERTLLLLADGTKSAQDFRPLFAGEGEQIALRLLRDGYLETHSNSIPLNTKALATLPMVATTAEEQKQNQPGPETVNVSADQFDGKRSLATTRMFLFDICERMFARRNPALADRFREALRDAKDRDAMLAVSRDMIDEIEKVAGHERADSISERLAMLLPSATAAA